MWNTWDSSVSCFTTIRTSLCIKVFYIDSSTVSVPNALITDIWSFFTNSALSWWLTIITQDIFSSTMFDIDQDSLCRVFFIFFTTTSFHLDVPLICTKLLCLSHITQNGFPAVVSWPSRNCGNVKSPDWQDSWQWGVGGGSTLSDTLSFKFHHTYQQIYQVLESVMRQSNSLKIWAPSWLTACVAIGTFSSVFYCTPMLQLPGLTSSAGNSNSLPSANPKQSHSGSRKTQKN